jgi:hypothetical protein
MGRRSPHGSNRGPGVRDSQQDLKGRLEDWRYAREVEALASAVRARVTADGKPLEAESLPDLWLEWTRIVFIREQAATDNERG